ncbi:alpha-ribazole phosphatase [Clostridium sp.]|uniref:alpha-ribazole phosphatase n=1 Tax=Clostridium sp. TaxID=1506 RepID=UPI003463D60B
MNIYLVRHGETEENLKKTYYGSIDCDLTENGINQALYLKEILSKLKFDAIFCSEKKRAKNTLEIIGHKENIIEDSRLNERDFGVFEGKTFNEINEAFKDEYNNWMKDWKGYTPPSGESFKTFYSRVKMFIEEMKDKDYDNVLIATHGGVIRAIYCYMLDENLDHYWRFASRNGDLTKIKFENNYFYIDSIIPLNNLN